MTKKFTPPTEFPHECLDVDGDKVILLGLSQDGERYLGEYLIRGDWFAMRFKTSGLRDIPTVTSTWQNVYDECGVYRLYKTRADADEYAMCDRINVLRRDTINGVTTCVLEDV